KCRFEQSYQLQLSSSRTLRNQTADDLTWAAPICVIQAQTLYQSLFTHPLSFPCGGPTLHANDNIAHRAAAPALPLRGGRRCGNPSLILLRKARAFGNER